jgi:hypothetical protein
MPFLPPSCRFPPLREGNRAEVRFPLPAGFPLREGNQKGSVPPACRGNLKEGVFKKYRAMRPAGGGCQHQRNE